MLPFLPNFCILHVPSTSYVVIHIVITRNIIMLRKMPMRFYTVSRGGLNLISECHRNTVRRGDNT